MSEILTYSQLIKKEAEELLKRHNLLEILEKYGEVKFTGSYFLDLMYKKDIDISLVNDSLSVSDFTALGKKLLDRLDTPSAYYRNTRITPVEKRPENSLYWGIKTGDWFIDIWGMSTEVYMRAKTYIDDIKNKLTNRDKLVILQLKDEFTKNKSYGKDFSSRELYDAVLNYHVKNSKQFKDYLENHSYLNEYQ